MRGGAAGPRAHPISISRSTGLRRLLLFSALRGLSNGHLSTRTLMIHLPFSRSHLMAGLLALANPIALLPQLPSSPRPLPYRAPAPPLDQQKRLMLFVEVEHPARRRRKKPLRGKRRRRF